MVADIVDDHVGRPQPSGEFGDGVGVANVDEELQYAGMGGAGNGITLANDILAPYFTGLCNDDQRDRWLPGLAAGTLIPACLLYTSDAADE